MSLIYAEMRMNLAYLSKEELLVVLVGFKNLNKRNIAVIDTDLYKFSHESNEENFNKFLVGIRSLYEKDYAELTNSEVHERFIYSYVIDEKNHSIKINFGQCIRTIFSRFKKNIDDISLSFLDFNLQSSKILLGMLVPYLKKGQSTAQLLVQEFTSYLNDQNNLKIGSLLKKACAEISSNSPVNLSFELSGEFIFITVAYKTKRKRLKQNGIRDLYTNDMFNGLTENDINHYLKNILKDQYFYLLYSKTGESKASFAKRIRALITCNEFPMLQEDVEAVKKLFMG